MRTKTSSPCTAHLQKARRGGRRGRCAAARCMHTPPKCNAAAVHCTSVRTRRSGTFGRNCDLGAVLASPIEGDMSQYGLTFKSKAKAAFPLHERRRAARRAARSLTATFRNNLSLQLCLCRRPPPIFASLSLSWGSCCGNKEDSEREKCILHLENPFLKSQRVGARDRIEGRKICKTKKG